MMMADRADTTGAWEHVEVLAGEIGPRPATGPAEARAHGYAEEVLRRAGFDVRVEPFRSQTTFTWPWLLVGSLVTAAGVLPWWPGLRVLAAAAGILGVAAFIGMADVALDVGRLFATGESRNVIGRLAPAGRPEHRVVLAAHADSTKAALLFHPAQARRFGTNLRVHMAGSVWVALAAVLGALVPGALRWEWIALPGLVPVVYGLVLLVHRELAMPWVQGANDNASGVGLALALAEHFSKNRPERTEIWVAITGCEEVGAPVGMARLVARHRAELRGASVLVLDNLGAGEIRYLLGEGNLRFHRSDPELVRLAAASAARHPDWRIGPSRVPPGSYTDAHASLAAGIPTLAIWAERDGGLPNWHWPTDVLANVEPETLARAFTFVREIVEAIDGPHRG